MIIASIADITQVLVGSYIDIKLTKKEKVPSHGPSLMELRLPAAEQNDIDLA